jgi:NAD(P)-dependent dehydrogenase (short-subunit alcohol dehydrogenase family)
MAGRLALITGGNAGLGKETAVALAAMDATVVFTSRDEARGAGAAREIRARSGNDTVEAMALDLARLASVRDFVTAFTANHDRLHVLVNNAGVVLRRRHETDDGYEMTFQVNHLAPFLLTVLLHDRLAAAEDGRVVNVASVAHRIVRRGLDFDDLQGHRRYRAIDAYCRTKLANILFTRELARRWAADDVSANAVNPGYVASRWGRDGDLSALSSLFLVLGRPIAQPPAVGARTQVYLASAPELAGVTGGYWTRSAPATPGRAALDDAAATRLWDVSEELAGLR